MDKQFRHLTDLENDQFKIPFFSQKAYNLAKKSFFLTLNFSQFEVTLFDSFKVKKPISPDYFILKFECKCVHASMKI